MDNINQCSDLWIDERYLVETKLGARGLVRESTGSNFPFLLLLIYVVEELRLLASRA
jgi:hypothetical protein